MQRRWDSRKKKHSPFPQNDVEHLMVKSTLCKLKSYLLGPNFVNSTLRSAMFETFVCRRSQMTT